MIILRNFSESEKKIKRIDEARISELQRHKKERDIRKDQYSEDPEIRKKANRKDVKRFLSGVGAVTAGSTALGAGIYYGATKLPDSVKDKLNLRKLTMDNFKDDFKEAVTTNLLPKAALITGIGLTAKAISDKRRNKRIKEGNLSTRDKKTIDQIKVAEGKMTRKEYIEKWGK